MAKKIISMILVLILLSLAMVACGGNEQQPTNDGQGTQANGDDPYGDTPEDGDDSVAGSEDLSDPDDGDDDDEEEETKSTTLGDGVVDEKILEKLPQADYQGKIYNISLPNSEHTYQFDAPRRTGDAENDAIYYWLKKVQDQFKVKIQFYNWNTDNDYYNNAKNDILSGQSPYQIYGTYAYRVGEFIMGDCFQDWNALQSYETASGQKYLDLSTTRWDQKLNSEVTYNGRLLSLTGDLGVSKLQAGMATFVNFDLLDEYCGVEQADLYGYVENGSWTFEKFKNLVKLIYEDKGAPGKDTSDVLGYYSRSGNSGDIWFPAFDREITARDEENNTISPIFMEDPYNTTIVQELRSFYWDTKSVIAAYYSGGPSSESKFASSELGFVTTYFKAMYGPEGFNTMDNFGVVPTPKWDTAQENYRTKLNDRYTIWGLPKSLQNADRQFTAHITDALCAESSETLYYQFYEVILKGRYSKDTSTAKMVDKVMEHVHFDTSIQFGTFIGDYTYLPRDLVFDMSMDIASTYDEAASGLEATLQDIYACYFK